MKKLFVSFILVLVFSASAFAVATLVPMDLAIDPAILGSSVVQILVFNGPGFKAVSVSAPGAQIQVANDWCIGPAIPKGDDLITLYFSNQKRQYRVTMDLNPWSGILNAWIVGADSPTLGQDFQILPNGTIQLVNAAPPGLILSAVKSLAVHPAGKIASTWGNIKQVGR